MELRLDLRFALTRALALCAAVCLTIAVAHSIAVAQPGGEPSGSGGLAQEEPAAAPEEAPSNEPALEDYEFMSCWGCHEAVTDEWARSAHALAWVDERYQAALAKKRRPDGCHGCHIPQLLQGSDLSRKPKPRDEDTESLHLGISCKSCHRAPDGAMLGPNADPVEVSAHVSRGSDAFTLEGSNALCIVCHQTTIGPVIGVAKDFVLSEAGARGKSCVECHMDLVERSWALDDEDQETPARWGRRHRLNGPRDADFLASAFALRAEVVEGRTRLFLANEAGHRVPGLVDRELEFTARVLDASGKSLGEASLVLNSRAYLAVDRERMLEIDAAGARVDVVGTHRAERLPRPVRFLEVQLVPKGASGG